MYTDLQHPLRCSMSCACLHEPPPSSPQVYLFSFLPCLLGVVLPSVCRRVGSKDLQLGNKCRVLARPRARRRCPPWMGKLGLRVRKSQTSARWAWQKRWRCSIGSHSHRPGSPTPEETHAIADPTLATRHSPSLLEILNRWENTCCWTLWKWLLNNGLSISISCKNVLIC